MEAGHHHAKGGFFGWFNRGFSAHRQGLRGAWSRASCARRALLVIYAAIIAAVLLLFGRLPTSFIPNEDQGNILVNVQLPPGATQNRTLAVMQAGRGHAGAAEVQNMACSASASPGRARTPASPS